MHLRFNETFSMLVMATCRQGNFGCGVESSQQADLTFLIYIWDHPFKTSAKFHDFWPLLPSCRQFITTIIRQQIWQIFHPSPPKKWSTPSEKILTHFDSKEKGRTRYFFSFRVPPLCTLYSWVNKTENDIWPHWWKEKCSLFKYSILFIWALVKPCCEEFWSRWKMNSKNVSKYLIFCDLHLLLFSKKLIQTCHLTLALK